MKTLLVGNFGARNVGDEMILASALERYPDAVVATADAEFSTRFQEKKFQTVLPFPTGLRSWIRFLSHPEATMRELKGTIDTIVFPGGGLLAIKDKAWWIKDIKAEKLLISQAIAVKKAVIELSR